MNLTFRFTKRPPEASEVLKRTAQIEGREFDVIKPVDWLMIRLGPYDNSDYIEIMELDGGEIAVLHECNGETECVLSVLPEEV